MVAFLHTGIKSVRPSQQHFLLCWNTLKMKLWRISKVSILKTKKGIWNQMRRMLDAFLIKIQIPFLWKSTQVSSLPRSQMFSSASEGSHWQEGLLFPRAYVTSDTFKMYSSSTFVLWKPPQSRERLSEVKGDTCLQRSGGGGFVQGL